MTAPLVSKFRNNVAPRLLSKFSNGGVATTVTITVDGNTPLAPPQQYIETQDVRSYVRGVSAQMAQADNNLQTTDLMAIFAAIDYTPSTEDYIEVNGKTRTVLRWDAIPANGDAALYKVYLR